MAACSGDVWTIPASMWPMEQEVPTHPPASEGPNAIAHKWHARLKAGQLLLPLPPSSAELLPPKLPAQVVYSVDILIIHYDYLFIHYD